MNIQELLDQIKSLDDRTTKLEARRITQAMIIPDSIKMRAIGEGVRYIRSGKAAARPVKGETPLQGSPIYFATDTNVLSVWNGTAWVSTTLS